MRLLPPGVRARIAVTSVVVLLATTGCGSRSADRVADLAEDLIAETDGALDDTQARCVAQALEDAYGDDAYQQVIDAVAGADDADTRAAVIDIFADCEALDPLLDAGA